MEDWRRDKVLQSVAQQCELFGNGGGCGLHRRAVIHLVLVATKAVMA